MKAGTRVQRRGWLQPAALALAGAALVLAGYFALQTAAGLAVLRAQRCADIPGGHVPADCAEVDPAATRGTRALWLLGGGLVLLTASVVTAWRRRRPTT